MKKSEPSSSVTSKELSMNFPKSTRETKGRALTLTPTFKRVLDASQIGGDYKKGGRRAGKREAIFHHGHAISISSQNNYHGRILKPPSPKAAGIVSKSLPNPSIRPGAAVSGPKYVQRQSSYHVLGW